MKQPFFSIGVVTYNRPDFLREAIRSILAQDFGDFEVIIGNDYTAVPVTPESLGEADPRVRICNHPRNLGEMKNLNAVLAEARGRYFTWLCDDDAFLPGFFQAAFDAFSKDPSVHCAFSSFVSGGEYPSAQAPADPMLEKISGADFLLRYLRREIRTVGCYGFFETGFLRSLGGFQQLGNGFSPYADNLLAIQAGGSPAVAFFQHPLVFFRTHENSMSFTSKSVVAYRTAQTDFLERSARVFRQALTPDEYKQAMNALLRWCIADIFHVMARSGSRTPSSMLSYGTQTLAETARLGGSRIATGLYFLRKAVASLFR